MTLFGEELRRLRAERGVTQRAMAAELGVSAAYLSALEHGKAGKPSFGLVQRIIVWSGLIWDEAERLQRLADLSDPRVTVDTVSAGALATCLANRMAEDIATLDERTVEAMLDLLDGAQRD